MLNITNGERRLIELLEQDIEIISSYQERTFKKWTCSFYIEDYQCKVVYINPHLTECVTDIQHDIQLKVSIVNRNIDNISEENIDAISDRIDELRAKIINGRNLLIVSLES